MRYKIKDIPSEGMLVEQEIARPLFADALEGLDADLDATTGNVRVELSKDGEDNVFAHGNVKALVTVPCAKCLQPALIKIAAPLKMTFVAGEADAAASDDDPLDDVDVTAHDGMTMDLEAIIREQLILGVPMSPRCKESCAGLCTVCGQNKNERDCGHQPPVLEDARLSALKSIKLEKPSNQ
jgi:DUF177 domain-containing protein